MSDDTPNSGGGYGPPGPGSGGYGPPGGGQPGPGPYGGGPAGPGQYGPGGPGQYGPGGPGQYGPGGPGQYGPGGYGQGEPSYQPAPARHRGAKALVIGLVVALVLGGGAFAVYKLDPFSAFSTTGPAAAEAVPADALFYVGVDLDPSAEQKVRAVQFLNHFPAFRDNVDVTDPESDIRRSLFDVALASSGCDLSFDDDIKPWLGYKFAVAGMPSTGAEGSSSPDVVFALEVSDEDGATDGLKKIASCSSTGSEFGLSFSGGYALLAETQSLADDYADDVAKGSLADDGDFKSDLDSLGNLGFATMWVDIKGAVELFAPPSLASGDLGFLLDSYQRAAATFRFESNSAEVVASVFGKTADIDHGDNKIVDLPESTAFAVSESGGKARLDGTWQAMVDAAQKNGVDVDSQIAAFEAQTGLSLPDDLATMLGDNIMFAVDAEGLSADALQTPDPSQINAGVRFTNDPADLNAVYDKVLAFVQGQTGRQLPVSKTDLDDGLVVATNDAYAKTLSEDGTLGDSEAFQSVTDDAAGKEFVLFFDFDSIEPQIVEAMRNDQEPAEAIDNVTPLQAFGITSEVDGDYSVTQLRMSVND